ncbi:MAG: tRNA pseudouridine(38-40) synthase TruA [Desulfarculus sp.]|nr:MAG: tRNA pseudouridine(38-40) synthase TruA [Desulfarculus sp.]
MADTLWARLAGAFPPHDVPFLSGEPTGGARRLALVLAYCGQGWTGWQVQPQAPTLQGALEAALGTLCDQPIRVHAAGRTDAGVHAWGQVAAFDTTSRLPAAQMLRGLRALLPSGLWPRALGPVAAEFHPRFQARGKTYDYYLLPAAKTGLFLEPFCWPLAEPLDAAAMAQALDQLRGEVDMAAFASQGSEVQGSTLRRLSQAQVTAQADGLLRVRLSASGFLRHSVRNLVGGLVQVGRGDLEPAALAQMAAAGRRLFAGPKAPPGGLYLNRAYYQSDPPEQDQAS